MTFTYDLANADATKVLISKVRLEIGDTVANSGVRPDTSNFTDEEIEYWLSEESNDVRLTAARVCDALASAWSIMADEAVGPRRTAWGDVANQWSVRASGFRASSGAVVKVL